jgi:hypothetical protein
MKKGTSYKMHVSGSLITPDWIRTSNLRFRRPMLYPIELRVRRHRWRPIYPIEPPE